MANGCSAIACDTLALFCTESLSIAGALNLNLYPNPGTGVFNLSVEGVTASSCSIEVYNLMGIQVYTEMLDVEGTVVVSCYRS